MANSVGALGLRVCYTITEITLLAGVKLLEKPMLCTKDCNLEAMIPSSFYSGRGHLADRSLHRNPILTPKP